MNRVLERLEHEHRIVLARMREVEPLLDDSAAVDGFLAFVDAEVAEHFALEEQVLFPELAQVASIASGPLRVMEAEHALFRNLRQAAATARQASEGACLATAVADLIALLRSHIAKEDNVLFPMALERMRPEQLTRLDRSAASWPQPMCEATGATQAAAPAAGSSS